MFSDLEVFVYEIGGPFEIRIYVNLKPPNMVSTVYWTGPTLRDEREVFPLDNVRMMGTFNQYLIGLGLNTCLPDPAIYKHMEDMVRIMKLVNRLRFENLSDIVKKQFITILKEGSRLWRNFFEVIPSTFEKKEVHRVLTLFSRFLMMYHLLLWEHEQPDEGMTRSPLWSR